ncbi:MAG: hypothetical protein ACPLRY_08035 [Candidatus Bathyarchaeales archaeon]
MKIESAIVAVTAVCVFLTFYFSMLSFQMVDDALKGQIVILAVLSLLTGILIFGCLIIYLGIRKVFVRAELRKSEESIDNA